jgi:benzoylformate decarboxylase
MGIPAAQGVEVPGVDFGSIARGFGCAAQRVDRAADLGPALRQAISANEPYLLDIRVGGAAPEIY